MKIVTKKLFHFFILILRPILLDVMIKNNLILPIVFVAIISTLSVPIMSAHAGGSLLSGYYDPSNWTTQLNGGDGTVIADNPSSVAITGDDSGQGPIDTSFSIVMPCDGNVVFNWSYQTFDVEPLFDPAGYSVDGVFTQISDNDGDNTQTDVETVPVLAGETFGFVVRTTDGIEGEARTFFTPEEFPPTECNDTDPVEKINGLIEDVDVLDLNQGNKNALTKKLVNAIKNITNEDPTDDLEACEKLQSFIDQLNAMVNSGKLAEGDVEDLISDADECIGALCFPG